MEPVVEGRSDSNRRRSASFHLYTNTSVELVWSFQTPDASPFHHLTLFDMSESYFTHYVNTSDPWKPTCAQTVDSGGECAWLCPPPTDSHPLSLSISITLSLPLTNECQFCGGASGMCC
ncbi:hypothetical protein GOODEAATRI_012708, partial [Goodea atripinnis]